VDKLKAHPPAAGLVDALTLIHPTDFKGEKYFSATKYTKQELSY
jgi:hypothetical protein